MNKTEEPFEGVCAADQHTVEMLMCQFEDDNHARVPSSSSSWRTHPVPEDLVNALQVYHYCKNYGQPGGERVV